MVPQKKTRHSLKNVSNHSRYRVEDTRSYFGIKHWVLVYILILAFIELANLFAGVAIASLASALLILALVNHHRLAKPDSGRDILLILMIAPLIRLTALVIPLEGLPLVYRYAVVGLPILLTEILMIRHLEIPFARFGFSLTSLKQKATQHLLILAPAILFSFIGFVLVKPAPLVEHAGWQQVLLSILVLTVFVGLVEEVFYRGLLLPAAEAVFGRAGLFISAFVYMLMYWGTHSVGYIVMMAVIGVFFGWHAKRTRSLWGVTLAHSLMMAGILLYWPLF